MDLRFRRLLLLFGDIVSMFVSLGVMLKISFWGEVNVSLFTTHVVPFMFLYFFWVTIFYILDLYDLSTPPTSVTFVMRYSSALILVFVISVIYFYLFSNSGISPKTNLVIHLAVFGILSFFWRIFLCSRFSPLAPLRIGLFARDTDAEELHKIIERYKHHGFTSVLFEVQMDRLAEVVGRERIHVVVLPKAFVFDASQTTMLYQCLSRGVTFLDVSQAYELFARRIPISTIDQQWFVRNVQENGIGLYGYLKRWVDIVGALSILVLTSPLWIFIALAIKLDDHGPIFYQQKRVGKNKKGFAIQKFRTMQVQAEAQGVQWAGGRHDARVTRVGRVLRKTHLDELPQMLNVLRGDISLVGPRPERPEFVELLEKEVPYYRTRHFVKPGFTGWAQIKFRYARTILDSQTKFEYDLYYIKNKSFVFDLLVLLKTAQLFFKGEG